MANAGLVVETRKNVPDLLSFSNKCEIRMKSGRISTGNNSKIEQRQMEWRQY
jgi:hypothetical protein